MQLVSIHQLAKELWTGLDCGTKARICNGALRASTDPELIWSRGLFANSKEDDGQEVDITAQETGVKKDFTHR